MTAYPAIAKEALGLSAEERIKLADLLLESLEGKDDAKILAQWAAESEDRLEAYEQGKVGVIPAEKVLGKFGR